MWIVVFAVVAIHAGLSLLPTRDFPGDWFILRVTDPNVESSLPTAVAAALLASIAVFAWMNAQLSVREARAWRGLALLFALGAVDEIASVHEALSPLLRNLFGFGGVFYYAWVVPVLVVLAILALAYWRFLLRLPLGVRVLVLGGAAVFVAGGVGLEMVGGAIVDRNGGETAFYEVVNSAEEVLELTGAMLMLHGFARYGCERARGVSFPSDRRGSSGTA